jgi:hypothetical protein
MTAEDTSLPEPGFTPEEFEETKYTEHFPSLQAAYKAAFEDINDRYDSELVHAIDQQVLSESEPFYEGDGEFELEVPDDPVARVAAAGVLADEGDVETVLSEYVTAIENALAEQFARKS